ncbi:MAG: gliding motility-associated C-terminal domain-containing protein [Elusimicrobia bacterium]|nr:gliding motility-associated C-terminal domain-containing protein [Elusimicrobiota bacterium]
MKELKKRSRMCLASLGLVWGISVFSGEVSSLNADSSTNPGGLSQSIGLSVTIVGIGPADVTDLVAVPGLFDGQIQLSWTEPGANGYDPQPVSSFTARASILQNIENNTDFNNPAIASPLSAFSPTVLNPSLGGNLRSDLLVGLTPGVTYYFAIRATAGGATNNWLRDVPLNRNATNYAVATDLVPSVPTGLTALSGNRQVALSWNPNPEPDIDFYRIWRDSLDPADFFVPITTTSLTTFTDTGLINGNSYYYRISAVDTGPNVLESPLTAWVTGYPFVVISSVTVTSITPDAIARSINLTWDNPNPDPKNVLMVRRAGLASTFVPVTGTTYSVGQTFVDGSTVVFNGGPNSTFLDTTGLTLNTSWFYTLFARDDLASPSYSIGTTTSTILDLKPLFPAGVDRSTGLASVRISWSAVTANEDGSLFSNPVRPDELARYTLYRSTGLWAPPSPVVSVSTSTLNYNDADPVVGAFHSTGRNLYYYVTASDSWNQESEASLIIGSLSGNLYKTSYDRQYLLEFDRSIVPYINAGNALGQNVHITSRFLNSEIGGRILQSVEFVPRRGDTGAALNAFALPEDKLDVRFYYRTVGNQVSFSPQLSVNQANSKLGVFWHNGREWLKLYGTVDPSGQFIRVKTPMFGRYQVREQLRSLEFTLDPSGVTNRTLTPNGDGKNDQVVFVFDNPSFSDVKGKIFDLSGAYVADMQPGPMVDDSLLWDGKAGGRVVASGVYIYQIESV